MKSETLKLIHQLEDEIEELRREVDGLQSFITSYKFYLYADYMVPDGNDPGSFFEKKETIAIPRELVSEMNLHDKMVPYLNRDKERLQNRENILRRLNDENAEFLSKDTTSDMWRFAKS